MTRVSTSNYAGSVDTTFQWATAGTDRFSRVLDLYSLAQALELHDHTAGKGLSVGRVGNGIIGTAALAAGAVDSTKLGTDAVNALAVALDAIGALELADNAVDTAAIQALAVTNAKLAVGAALANLGYTPVNKAGDTGLGAQALASGSVLSFPSAGNHTWSIFSAAGGFWLYDATTGVPQFRLTDSSGVPTVYDGTAFRNLLRAGVAEIVAADLASNAVTTAKILDANVTTAKINDDAVTPAKLNTTDTPNVGEYVRIDPADATKFEYGTLPAASVGIPSGYGGWVPTAAAIPTGHTRYTALDGRYPVGAGAASSPVSGPVTFVQSTDYGTSPAFTPLGGVIIVVGDNNAQGSRGSSGSNTADSPHQHAIASQVFTGIATSWQPPSRGVVWITKD